MKVAGKVALVTGANRGIGKAIVDAFVGEGASKVYLAVRDIATAQPLVERYGNAVVPIKVDLSQPATMARAAEQATDVEIVVNNAGVLRRSAPLDKNAIEDLTFEIDTNVFGLMHMAQAFAPVLKANGGGTFIQLNSIASMQSFMASSTYCASKAAAYSMTQALRLQLGQQGTRVFSVHPGPIATDMAADAGIMDIAEPANVVGQCVIEALEGDDFHVYPDAIAKTLGANYASFAKNVIETENPD